MSELLYHRRADIYDRIYHLKPYGEESARIAELLRERGLGEDDLVLDIACGTARHLEHLARHFKVRGRDLSQEMVQLGGDRIGHEKVSRADMREPVEPELVGTVGAVLLLFSSVGYIEEDEDLARALANIHASLRPGGALLLEPWLQPTLWQEGRVTTDLVRDDDLHICRMTRAGRDGDVSVLEMHYLIGEVDGEVQSGRETHRLRMRDHAALEAAMVRAGFTVERHEELLFPRGLLIARKP